MKLSLPWVILNKILQNRIKIFILLILNVTLVLLSIFNLKEYFKEKENFDALQSNVQNNIESNIQTSVLSNVENSNNFDITPFVYTIDSVNNFIYTSLTKKIKLVSNEQNFTLLHNNNEKQFFLIDYKLQFTSNYNELMQLLEKFSDSNMIYKISDLSFANEDYSKLQIILNLQVLAYDNK